MTRKKVERTAFYGSQAIDRREFLRLGGYISGVAALSAAGIGRGTAATGGKTLTLGNSGWDECVALANLTKAILEQELGYDEVKIVDRRLPDLFEGVADGSLDAFQDVWLPRTHRSYWAKYQDKVAKMDSWYQGSATLGLTVPDYVQAKSIADLPVYADTFGGKIVGIEPDAGEMQIVKNAVMPGYGLGGYQLTSSSTPDMLAQLEKALRAQKPIVVTLYKPHWAFNVYKIRYLDDPQGLMNTSSERLYSIARKRLQEEKPEAYAFMNAVRLNREQLGWLELAVNQAGDPAEGVRTWLRADRPFGGNRGLNRELVQPWIDAARRASSSA